MSNKLVLKENIKDRISIDEDTEIEVSANTDAVLVAQINKETELNIQIDVKENASLTIFYNNASANLKVNECGNIYENAKLKVAYCELESKELTRDATFCLLGRDASVSIIGGSICSEKKVQNIECIHQYPHTTSEIESYGLVLNSGDYYVKAIGTIQKGSYASKSHQTSRVLTFADKQNATILPMLLIDENDVEASHATSIGQLDENQLYYLMSRGLNENEALRLLSLGYLLPLCNVTDDVDLRKDLTDLIEKKVEETCLI